MVKQYYFRPEILWSSSTIFTFFTDLQSYGTISNAFIYRKKQKKMSSKDDKIKPKSSTEANDTFEEPPTKKPKVVTGKKSKGFKVKLRTKAPSNPSPINQESQPSTSQKISCLSCGKEFAHQKSLNNHKFKFPACKAHYNAIRQSDPEKVTCVYCGKKYQDKKNIRNHVQQNKHCRKLHEKYQKKTLNQEDQDLNDKKEFQCKKCNTKFVSAASLKSHCNKFKH